MNEIELLLPYNISIYCNCRDVVMTTTSKERDSLELADSGSETAVSSPVWKKRGSKVWMPMACGRLKSIQSFALRCGVQSTQSIWVKDTKLENYFGISESHPYEYWVNVISWE